MYGNGEHGGPTELGESVRESVRRTQSGKYRLLFITLLRRSVANDLNATNFDDISIPLWQ